jgi:hypothetical protein
VVDARVKIGVVTDAAWQREFDSGLCAQAGRERLPLGAAAAERVTQPSTERTPCWDAERHEAEQIARGERLEPALHLSRPRAGVRRERQVEHLIADRDATAQRFARALRPKAPERQVLQRKISSRGVGRVDPALACWIECAIDRAHVASILPYRSPVCLAFRAEAMCPALCSR